LNSDLKEPTFASTPSPGIIGAIVRLHGVLYAQEYGWDWTFEAYVAEGLSRFALDYDPKRDRIWVVEEEAPPCVPPGNRGGEQDWRAWSQMPSPTHLKSPPSIEGGEIQGCITVAHASEADWQAETPAPQAQLRWYLVHPSARGQGLGKRLMDEALRFCREAGYKSVFLWTTSDLKAAAHVYLSVGFRKTEEKTHRIWGKTITEERYELSVKV